MPLKKSQIALEYMLVFSIVLVIFAVLFAEVSTQRVQQQNRQLYSVGQAIAQGIAAQLDAALQAGPGYAASVPLATAIGSVNYNLSITRNGAVIVNSLIGGQVVQAVAYSSVKGVVSNPSYLTANSAYYAMPTANGSLEVQNSFGTICIDYQCPTAGGQATNVSLSAQVTHAGNFNGQSSYVNIPDSSSLQYSNGQVTYVVWFKTNSLTSAQGIMAQYGAPYIDLWLPGTGQLRYELYTSTMSGGAFTATLPLANTWYQAVLIYNGATMVGYLNGVPVQGSVTTSGGTMVTVSPLALGNYAGYLNGSLANVQVYGTALSQGQVQQLYQGGISGTPLSGAGLVGWWPLNGNAQDYSGNNDNGNVVGPLTYTTVAQLFAKATNQFGQTLPNALVGFATTSGNFTKGQATASYTNSNGIATAFLSQQGNNGQALVKAVAFNGNATLALQGNLVGWWPLNLGQGGAAADLSGNGNSGAMSYASWSQPNYVAKFDGASSYVATGNSLSPPLTSGLTASIWFNDFSPSFDQVFIRNGQFALQDNGNSAISAYVCVNGGWVGPISASFSGNTWLHAVETWSGTTYALYINGVAVATGSASGALGFCDGSVTSLFMSHYYAGDWFLNGEISDAQVYSSALSANQIQTLYREGISGPPLTSSGLSGWWPLDGDANDYSGNGNSGVIYGNLNFAGTSSIPNVNANATSMLTGNFNGQNGYVVTGTNGLPLGNAPSSAFAWIYDKSPSSNLDAYSYGSDGAVGRMANLFVSSGTLGFWNGASAYASPLSVLPNTWYFAGYAYSGNTLTLYLNNLAYSQTVTAQNIALNVQNPSVIGGDAAAPVSNFWSGSLADVQAYGTALSANQVQSLYQEGISGLPLGNSGLAGWWPLDGNAQDYSGNGNNGTAIAANYISQRAIGPYLISSLNSYGAGFNGQSSYVSISPTALAQGNQVTMAVWADQLGPGNSARSVMMSQYATYLDACNSGAPTFATYTSGWGFATGGTCPANGIWKQYVGTYDGSMARLYVNGVLVANAVQSGNLGAYGPTSMGDWGLYSFYNFNGLLADAQVYSTALSPSQVQQLYQSQMPPSASASVPLGWVP